MGLSSHCFGSCTLSVITALGAEMAERPQHPFLGSVFSGPEIKHKLMAQVHHFPLTQLELPEEQSFESQAKGKQSLHQPTALCILEELHGQCKRGNSSWQSCTMAATQPTNKEEEKLPSPHCQTFYRINHVSDCTSFFCSQPDGETLKFSNQQKNLMLAHHYILCDD